MILHCILAEEVASNVNWSLIASIVLTVFTGLMWWDSKKNRGTTVGPQPFEVVKAKQFVNKETFERFVGENKHEHENLFAKIGGVERGARQHLDQKLDAMQAAGEASREKLHDRINDVLEAVSELRGEMKNKRAES